MAVLSLLTPVRIGDDAEVSLNEVAAVVADRIGVDVTDGFTFVSSSVSDSSSLDSSSLDSSDSSFLGGVVVVRFDWDWRNRDWKGFFSVSLVVVVVVAAVADPCGRDRIGGNSDGFTDAGPGDDAASLELSVDELSLDDRAGGDSFCADALDVVVVVDVCVDYK